MFFVSGLKIVKKEKQFLYKTSSSHCKIQITTDTFWQQVLTISMFQQCKAESIGFCVWVAEQPLHSIPSLSCSLSLSHLCLNQPTKQVALAHTLAHTVIKNTHSLLLAFCSFFFCWLQLSQSTPGEILCLCWVHFFT